MQMFSIEIRESSQNMDKFLSERIVNDKAQGICVERKKSGNALSINYISDNEQYNELREAYHVKLKKHVIDMASDIILFHINSDMIEKMIQDEYFYFDKPDRKKILHNAINALWKNKTGEYSWSESSSGWGRYVQERVTEHFESNNALLIEGFIRFRLKDFVKEMQHIIDRAVRELLIEKEYNDFIKLLRYFVEIQQPKLEEVHVLPAEGKKYTLLDDRLKIINNEMLEDMAKEISDMEIDNDDLLISSLITIAPNKITIHDCDKIKNAELLNTINKVFRGKVIMNQSGVPSI